MQAFGYLAVLAGCFLVTLPLELVLGARVYRRPRRLALTLAAVVVVFGLWDLLAVARGHWSFATARVSGLSLAPGMPVEELLFFLVVPTCALLTYEGLGVVGAWLGERRSREQGRGGDA